jgi:hypothetical protein
MKVKRSLRGLMLIHIAMGFAFTSAQEDQLNSTTSQPPQAITQPPSSSPPPSNGKFGTTHLHNNTLKTL